MIKKFVLIWKTLDQNACVMIKKFVLIWKTLDQNACVMIKKFVLIWKILDQNACVMIKKFVLMYICIDFAGLKFVITSVIIIYEIPRPISNDCKLSVVCISRLCSIQILAVCSISKVWTLY